MCVECPPDVNSDVRIAESYENLGIINSFSKTGPLYEFMIRMTAFSFCKIMTNL